MRIVYDTRNTPIKRKHWKNTAFFLFFFPSYQVFLLISPFIDTRFLTHTSLIKIFRKGFSHNIFSSISSLYRKAFFPLDVTSSNNVLFSLIFFSPFFFTVLYVMIRAFACNRVFLKLNFAIFQIFVY